MKKLLFSILFSAFTIFAYAVDMEQKIIIQDGYYHYITIDEETQLATLHKGKTTQTLQQNTQYPLPMGRNFDEPFIQFSWDIKDGVFLGNNVLRHPLNDLAEGIKKMEWNAATDVQLKDKAPFELIMLGVDYNMWMYNKPFVDLRKADYSFENYYYDMSLINKESMLYLLSNKGKSTLWKYDNDKWHSLFTTDKDIKTPFSLLYYSHSAWIIQQNKIIEINPTTGAILADYLVSEIPSNYIIVDDRDQKCIGFISKESTKTDIPFTQIIKNYNYKITKS